MIRTVEELFSAWPAAAAGIRARSQATIEHTLKMADPFRVAFGRRVLVDFARDGGPGVARWAGKHPGSGRYARTIMADAVLLGLVDRSPFTGVGGLQRPSTRDFIPTQEQVLALSDAGERYGLMEWVMVAAYSGARLSALAALTAGKVEITGGTTWRLHLKRKRRPGTYQAVLLPRGVFVLGLVLPERSRDLVFRRPKGGAWDIKSISRCWVKMRREFGLPEECTSHCLRKFYATTLVDRGVSFEDVAIALDHVDDRGRPNTEHVRSIYSRPDRDAALARVAGIAA